MHTQALRRATGTLHRLHDQDRQAIARQFINREVLVSWNGHRNRDNAYLTRGRCLAVAHPLTGAPGAMVIIEEWDGATVGRTIALSLATVFDIQAAT